MRNQIIATPSVKSYTPFDDIMSILIEMKNDISELKEKNDNSLVDDGVKNKPGKTEVAAYMGVSKSTLDKIIGSGCLPFIRIGRQIRFNWTDVNEYLNSQKQERRTKL